MARRCGTREEIRNFCNRDVVIERMTQTIAGRFSRFYVFCGLTGKESVYFVVFASSYSLLVVSCHRPFYFETNFHSSSFFLLLSRSPYYRSVCISSFDRQRCIDDISRGGLVFIKVYNTRNNRMVLVAQVHHISLSLSALVLHSHPPILLYRVCA